MPAPLRTFHLADFTPRGLLEAKGGRLVSVCIPSRDEERTVGEVVTAVSRPLVTAFGGSGLVDEVLVVDDGSSDATAEVARRAGAKVVGVPGCSGSKGAAMRAGLEAAAGDVVVFLDADVENTTEAFVTGLIGPLLLYDDIALVKGCYERPLGGEPTGGGRVTELVARPLIELLFPELAGVRQPLAGETAAPRWVLEKIEFAAGYGVELGLLVDVSRRFGVSSIAQVDLGVRVHRNRPLEELRPQALDVLRAALARAR
ncbi:MAG TPA: glucosyl-3-phosphoglycerate synthase [Acidimicrobiales bacterium]|nr:glucosyl-3-phosphoglycerate synthase [Acidimicrobiales bacterium]